MFIKTLLNKNLILSAIVLTASILVSYVLIANAISREDIVFPVKELGNCQNESECKTFCDKSENLKPCIAFSEKYNLLSADDLAKAKRFSTAGAGPGGCKTQEQCETYCNDASRLNECLAFAEKNGLMSPEELKEAKQVKAALDKGAKMPGGCSNKKSCDTYCESPDHMEECISFAEAAGFMPESELANARKALVAVKKGVKPPACRGEKECNEYCSEPENLETCLTFAEAAGFMSPEELSMARKTGGKGPGGCRGRECEGFCENENNFQTCVDFSIEHGLMSADEAEIARKTGGKGPGNCKGREECDAFCKDPANQETCFNFAKEHGLISEKDQQEMNQGRGRMTEAFQNAPPEVMECLNSSLGAGFIEELKNGAALPSKELGDKMQSCFSKFSGNQMGPSESGGGPSRSRGETSGINVVKGQFGITVEISLPDGVQEFAITPASGAVYSGGLSGCQKTYKAETNFSSDAYPLVVSVTDCKSNTQTFNVPAEGRYGGSGGGPEERQGMPGEPRGGQQFSGPGGCKSEEECKVFCQSNPRECQNFGPPGVEQEQRREQEQERMPWRENEPPMPPVPGNFVPPVNNQDDGTTGGFQRPPTSDQIDQMRQQFEQQFQQRDLPPGNYIAPSISPEQMTPPPPPPAGDFPAVSPVEPAPPMEIQPSAPAPMEGQQLPSAQKQSLFGELLQSFLNLFR